MQTQMCLLTHFACPQGSHESQLFPADGSVRRFRGGIKQVQSLHNLTSYAHDEMTRVVSERTVCYCSNFDLDTKEWRDSYQQLK